MQTTDRATDRHESDAGTRARGRFQRATDPDPGDVLDALSDESCRRVLDAARDPATAHDLADATGLSLSTTYRKLDRLTNAGLLDVQTEIREDGYHTAWFRTAVDAARIRFGVEDGFRVTLNAE